MWFHSLSPGPFSTSQCILKHLLGDMSVFLFVCFKVFFLFVFWCGPFLKSLLNLLQYCSALCFWYFGCEACRILAPWPGIEPKPSHWKAKSLSPDHQGSPQSLTGRPLHIANVMSSLIYVACPALTWFIDFRIERGLRDRMYFILVALGQRSDLLQTCSVTMPSFTI